MLDPVELACELSEASARGGRLAGQLADVRRRLELLAGRASRYAREEATVAMCFDNPSWDRGRAEGRAQVFEWAENEVREILDTLEGKP